MADVYFINKCTYCQNEINGLKVQCCVCEDFILCLQCFSAGAELGNHKRNHPYKFKDDWSNKIIVKGDGDWTAYEEIRLLDCIEVFGYGNWDAVKAIMDKRSTQELKDHYSAKYLNGVIGKATWANIKRPDLNKNNELYIKRPDLKDLAVANKRIAKLPPLDITLEEAQLLSYVPKRGDFDRETSTDIEAEQLVSSLNGVTIDNEELDTSLKLAQVDMYIRRLRERVRKKRIVREYQLIAKFFASHRKHMPKLNLTKEQREFRDRMRVFSQFTTATEHECLISGLEREQELRLRLNELARYRQAGLTNMDECVHYEQHLAFDRRNQNIHTSTPASALTPATHQWKHAKSGSSGSGPYFQEVPQVGRRENVDVSNFIDQKYMYHTDGISINENQEIRYAPQPIPQHLEKSLELPINNNQHKYIISGTPTPANELLPKPELQNHLTPDKAALDLFENRHISKNYEWDPNYVNAITSYLESNGWLS